MSLDTERARARPVMTDVARLAGVSQKTVSRVVNDAPNVRPDVRDRVAAAIDALGYRPNAAARALVTNRTRVIGIVTPGSALYGPSAQLLGVERSAWRAGYSVLIVSTFDGSTAELVGAVRQLHERGVDGIVLAGPIAEDPLPPDWLHGTPVVTVGEAVTHLACPGVMPDQRGGARAATEHLLGLGHRTVWHVAGPSSWEAARGRVHGWREALAAAGAPAHDPVEGDWSPRAGYAAGVALAARPDVTAVFAANDQMAVGVMRAFVEAGRRIPEDVSVVGFDDVPDSEYLLVPLTTVRQDLAAISERAVADLISLVEGRGVDDGHTVVPVELVIRSSSGPPPPTHGDVLAGASRGEDTAPPDRRA